MRTRVYVRRPAGTPLHAPEPARRASATAAPPVCRRARCRGGDVQGSPRRKWRTTRVPHVPG
ncbi:hypothetical protein AMK09_16630 [Streptomyces sp. CB02488]|nr:hypothetical protein AMK09_16630 [Streptomyces sp. CB02488]